MATPLSQRQRFLVDPELRQLTLRLQHSSQAVQVEAMAGCSDGNTCCRSASA
ncbi:MAG: hypothetical protein R2843_07115 [Thermomicrobiales bacterium]